MIKFTEKDIKLAPETDREQSFFCSAWPSTKLTLQAIITIVPSVKFFFWIRIAVTIIISAGDAIYAKACRGEGKQAG